MRSLLVALGCALSALAFAAPAQAADLLILQGETVEISGAQTYGFVYVDGALRLTGDTGIVAGSVYLGPNASLDTCFVSGTGPGTGGNQCGNGRSLTIRSSGPVVLTPGIDLTGGQGATQAGGSLDISGAGVTVGGAITTSGLGGAASGAVSISSTGGIDVGGTITTPSAPVRLAAAGDVQVNGDISTFGTAATPLPASYQAQGGGAVDLSSSSGNVLVSGNIVASGRDQAGGGLYGGPGAPVALSGGQVRVGNIDTTGGSSTDHDPGPSAPIKVSARGDAHVLGRLDASGQNSNVGVATGGSTIDVTAAGLAIVAGGGTVQGGSAPTAGGGGTFTVKGGSAVLGALSAFGGNATSASSPHDGGAGGAIKVASAGAVSTASLLSYGGNAPNGGTGGGGGSVDVAGGSISATQVSSAAGTTAGGPGAAGGSIRLFSDGNLAVANSINTSGSAAAGSIAPARVGGAGGPILLRAAAGTLTLAGNVLARGANGGPAPASNLGGAGGAGGRVDVVARTIGNFVSISTHGGNGAGNDELQGPGGAGGSVHAWTDGTIFDDQRVVDVDGGDGTPLGASGSKIQESSPTGLAVSSSGAVSFASHSPGAEAYQVLRSVAGAAATVVGTTTATSGILPPAPVCTPVTFTVVAYHNSVGWSSSSPAPVAYVAQPSATQTCAQAPALSAKSKKLKRKLRTLRKAKWRFGVTLSSNGIGTVDASLRKRKAKKALASVSTKLEKAGNTTLRLTLPKSARRRGRYTLRLVTTAPDGKAKATITLNLEVRR